MICDLCECDIAAFGTFYVSKTHVIGMCAECHDEITDRKEYYVFNATPRDVKENVKKRGQNLTYLERAK